MAIAAAAAETDAVIPITPNTKAIRGIRIRVDMSAVHLPLPYRVKYRLEVGIGQMSRNVG